ncbi:MAG: TolC family protein, partial [Acidobacteria bacterium]|nr:TolC family protein [Acidobacteriota bacterium]
VSKARRAYWELVYQREVVELLVDAQEQNESNLVAARKRIAAGLATETDRIEFEMYRVGVEQDLARMRLGSANSQRTLSILLGHSENTLIQTDTKIPHQHDDALLSAKFNAGSHRDVRATQASEEVAESQRSQAYRWWTPQLDVYASYSLYTLRERDFLVQSERFEPVAGVRLRFNLFDGLQSRLFPEPAHLYSWIRSCRLSCSYSRRIGRRLPRRHRTRLRTAWD